MKKIKSNYKIQNIIHLGANKTATTSFQEHLFTKISTIGYLGNKQIQNKMIEKELRNLRMQDDYYYNSINIKKKIKQIKKKRINIFLYSDEDILTSNNLTRCSLRLKHLLPDAKIVLTIRNQVSALESWYASHGKFLKMVPKKYYGKHVSFNDWLDYCFKFREDFVTPLQSSPFRAMDYKQIIEIFSENFGLKNIKLLLYEDLTCNRDKLFKEWAKLLNIDKEIIKKKLSKSFLRKSKKKKKLISNKNLKNIVKYFSKGNYEINKNFKLNLKKYNYPL